MTIAPFIAVFLLVTAIWYLRVTVPEAPVVGRVALPGGDWIRTRHPARSQYVRPVPQTIRTPGPRPLGFVLVWSAALPSDSSDEIVKNPTFDLNCEVISDIQIKVCNIFGKVMSRAMECRSGIDNRSNSL